MWYIFSAEELKICTWRAAKCTLSLLPFVLSFCKEELTWLIFDKKLNVPFRNPYLRNRVLNQRISGLQGSISTEAFCGKYEGWETLGIFHCRHMGENAVPHGSVGCCPDLTSNSALLLGNLWLSCFVSETWRLFLHLSAQSHFYYG